MDRLLADDAHDGVAARVEDDTLTDEDLRVPAADGAEPQVSVVADVRDDQPDLVDVAHDQQPARRGVVAVFGRDERERRADEVDARLRELARRVAPHPRGSGLITRRSTREQQVA
jgi:hypothetical protein